MLVKYLHERKEIDNSQNTGCKPSKLTLEYYVLEEEGDGMTSYISAESCAHYGVMVVLNDSLASPETKFLRDVTPYEAEARKYARILAENCVTPCGLLDVMEDLVADAVSL